MQTVGICVGSPRDLPIMDTKGKNRSTDAFVEVMVPGSRKKISKTDICKRTLNRLEFQVGKSDGVRDRGRCETTGFARAV